MKISVFTDYRFTASENPTGVGKHVQNMVSGLRSFPSNSVSLLCTRDQIAITNRSSSFFKYNMQVQGLPLTWRCGEMLWTAFNFPHVDSLLSKPDWVYCPKNDFISVRKSKLAVTVHGAHELDPSLPPIRTARAILERLRRRLAYKKIVSNATLVLTVSNFLKAQIIDWFACEETKVQVVGNGVEQAFFDAGATPVDFEIKTRAPFLLVVGGLNFLDGAEFVLACAKALSREFPLVKILVAGTQNDDCFVKQADLLSNIEMLGYVESSKLAFLMRDALALLYSPTYETFGIAGAEALAVGTPVITTGSTAIPEILGSSAFYVSADISDTIDLVKCLLNQEGFSLEKRALGQKKALDYSWSSCVNRLQASLLKYN